MKKTLSLFASLALIIGISAALPTDLVAKGRKGKGKAPAAKKQDPVVQNKITAVSGNSITVSSKHGSQTYTIGEFTTIMISGHRSTMADLKPGMGVMVGGTSGGVASSINANGGGKK